MRFDDDWMFFLFFGACFLAVLWFFDGAESFFGFFQMVIAFGSTYFVLYAVDKALLCTWSNGWGSRVRATILILYNFLADILSKHHKPTGTDVIIGILILVAYGGMRFWYKNWCISGGRAPGER